jgi:hypothetical protein
MSKTVHIVHCIDTEGPLFESLGAKFERLRELFGITDIEPTRANLGKLQRGEVDLSGKEDAVKELLSSHRSKYNETWTELDAMLEQITAPEFRRSRTDSIGNGWRYSWFCMDHIGFDYNPRRRDIGYHNIFDRYRDLISTQADAHDGLQWHFHPMSTYRDAHRCGTHYFRDPVIFQILARKVIERGWFPAAYRAGFQAERPDSHWFLEQWIPFDITNMALDDNSELDRSIDLRNGRSADWRQAPSDWSIYNPSHDNYQRPGTCRRVIARCLNVLNRIASIDQREMDKAFARAADGATTLVGICSHDWRDMGAEVEHVRDLVDEARRRFPGVEVRFSEVVEAFRAVLWPHGPDESALDLELILHPASNGDVASIEVHTKSGKVFGPQPFLAIETIGRQFIHDNFDFSPCGTRWHYALHDDTLPLDQVARIGVAANDRFGNTCVRHLILRSS